MARRRRRSSKYQSHHDGLFRAAFDRPEALRAEAEVLLPPAIIASLDFQRVDMLHARFVDESLAASESDAAFRVAQHGRPAFVYVLLEHQRTSDPLMPWRLLRYMTNLWLSVLGREPARTQLPVLLPMVLSNVPGGWRGPRSFAEVLEVDDDQVEVFAPFLPSFPFVIDDLAATTTDALQARPGPDFTRLALWLLAASSDPERVIGEAPRWSELVYRLQRRAPHDHRRAVMYLLRTVQMTEAQRKKIKKLFWMGPDRRTVTVEDIAFAGLKQERAEARRAGREEGRQEGREEGREEGYVEALRDLVRAQLVLRFGRLPRGAATKLERATVAQLRRFGARLVKAKNPSDVFG